MPVINVALQTSVRNTTKDAIKNISQGKVKSGKEVVRDGRQKLLSRSLNRHKAVMAKFVAEEGRGSRVSFDV